ncbi:MAG: metallopeptidase TldD-related protein, partial [Mariprofundaceae bacterium]
EGDGMQRDYAWHQAHASSELRNPADLGREAAERAVRRLGATGMESARLPVVFEPRIAVGLPGHLAAAVNGRAVLQQRSFLADAMGERILPAGVNIVDDPDHPEGLGNRLFDGEGTRCRRLSLVEDGRLRSWLTNRYAARRLNAPATGHASRGLTGDIGIAPSNLILEAGTVAPETLIADIERGLWVTELIGFGVNGVTGDYSRGAAGFLIEQGRIARPVQGVTIAGNLREMFAHLTPASDLTWFGSRAAPSVRIESMTIAG